MGISVHVRIRNGWCIYAAASTQADPQKHGIGVLGAIQIDDIVAGVGAGNVEVAGAG